MKKQDDSSKPGEAIVVVASIVTVLWMIGVIALLVFRSPDFLPLLEPTSSTMAGQPNRLQLNDIGDALGGAFAPLAFLWLFVATWLQRLELQEQRRESAETRGVFEQQHKSMADQAQIMSDTWILAQIKDVYDQHSLELYYFALELLERRSELRIGMSYLVSQMEISASDQSTVDRLLISTAATIGSRLHQIEELKSTEQEKFAYQLRKLAINSSELQARLEKILLNEAYNGNRLTIIRIHGAKLGQLNAALSQLYAVVQGFDDRPTFQHLGSH